MARRPKAIGVWRRALIVLACASPQAYGRAVRTPDEVCEVGVRAALDLDPRLRHPDAIVVRVHDRLHLYRHRDR